MCFTQSQSMTWCLWEALWPSTAKVCRWSRQAIGRTFISITHAFSSVSRWFLESVLGGHGCIRLQLLGKQRWLSTRWAFRRYGFGESVNVTDQSCLRGCGLKVVASKRILFWNSAGFWPLRDFGVNHLESILQGWLTCRSQRAQHSGSVYGIFIPLALLHLFLRQHLLMRSCRSVAAVTQVGHNGNLTVPWCTSLIHAGIASNC